MLGKKEKHGIENLPRCPSGTILPAATPENEHEQQRSLRELIPNNFGVFGDIAKSLRSRNYRIYFIGQLFSLTGFWIQQIAMSWLVLSLSPEGDLMAFSTVIFLANIPSLFMTPFSGIVCDMFDRRKILLCTQTLVMLQSITLAVLTLTGLITIPMIMILSLFFGMVVSFDAPARQSFYAKLVPISDLSNAIALNSIAINGTRLIGPALGGAMITLLGEGWCFVLNSCSFVAVLGALYSIKIKSAVLPNLLNPIAQIVEGFKYAAQSIPLRSIILLLMAFSILGVPLIMVLPAFVKDVLMGESTTLGILMSCVGVGAMIAAIYLAARKSVLGLGKVVMFACMIFGIAEILMSFAHEVWIAMIICFPLGFGMIAVAASSNTLLQTIVDESKRGRIMSIFTMCFFGIPPIGSLAYGYFGDLYGLRAVMLVCGILCIISSLVFMKYRTIIRTHTRKIYVEKGIISEIAVGLRSSNPRV